MHITQHKSNFIISLVYIGKLTKKDKLIERFMKMYRAHKQPKIINPFVVDSYTSAVFHYHSFLEVWVCNVEKHELDQS